MLIQIIKGVYGLKTDTGIKPISKSDGAFNLDDPKAERLLKLGVAIKVETPTEVATDAPEVETAPTPTKKTTARKKKVN